MKVLTILVVDDDAISRLFMKVALEYSGHTVVDSANGRDALSILKEQNFDLIFIDVMMPIIDGLEATICIRHGDAGEVARNTPIIILSAYNTSAYKSPFSSLNISDYLTKPIPITQLRQIVEQFADS